MLPPEMVDFRHELVSTVLVSALIGGVMWPIRAIKAEWRAASNKLADVHTQSEKQVELLSEAVKFLGNISTSQVEVKNALESKHIFDTEKLAEAKAELKDEANNIKVALDGQHDKQQLIWQGVLHTLTVLEDRTRNMK